MDKQGFTLIELVVVFALISIIAVIGIPKLPIDGFYLDSVAEELVYDIRYVKSIGMSEPMKMCSIVLSNDLDHYDYCFYSIRKTKHVMNKVVKKVKFKKGYTLSYNKSHDVMFNVNGTPKQAQTITILHESTGNFRKITIVPSTGRVLLE